MNIIKSLCSSLAIATVALGLATASVNAQLAPAAPAAPAAPKLTPAAPPKVAAPAPAAGEPAAKAKKPRTAAAASVCRGLDEAGCGANAECQYITPKKATSTTGAALKPYCRTKPKTKAAAAAAKGTAAAPAAGAPAAGAPAAAAPKAAAPATPPAAPVAKKTP